MQVVTIKVTFHGSIASDDGAEPFVRYFPDMGTWERVRNHLRWTYAAIEVEPVYGVIRNKRFEARIQG